MIHGSYNPALAQRYTLVRYIDSRGWFTQAWTDAELHKAGFRPGFLQQNIASSAQGVLRGMHRQDQTKLVTVLSGRIFDVALDVETGQWQGFELVEGDALLIPPGLAHGYLALQNSLVQYFVDRPYDKGAEECFAWNGYGIEWPLTIKPILSARDEP